MASRGITRISAGYPLVLGVNKIAGGYNFALEIPDQSEASLLLYRKKNEEPVREIPFCEGGRNGSVSTLFLEGIRPEEYEYNFRIDGKVVQDPYAYRILGKEQFGVPVETEKVHQVRCGFLSEKPFDWEEDKSPFLPMEDMILYKLHVRGYTKQAKINARKRGTFSGLAEMIPYLKEMGINAVELMPACEFPELLPEEPSRGMVTTKKNNKLNYWGYLKGFYFAPKASYCATKEPDREFREMVKALHKAGIECIMEFYFPADTNPFVVLRALQFWNLYYHVDGFHLIGGGIPMEMLLKDSVLSHTKLFFDNLPQGGIPEERYIGQRTLGEYNAGFLQDMRRFLKSDEDTVSGAMRRIRENSRTHTAVHFMSFQDGFTLADSVSYNYRHNEENGEDNRDGSSYNYSWNCGIEGPSRKAGIRQMRERQMRNAFLMVLLSQGIPMIYGGDEFANSQNGNNNAYCQDNPIGWTDWKNFRKNEELLKFVKEAIAYRKAHPVFRSKEELKGVDYLTKGFPDISFHGERAWYCNEDNTSRLLGVLYCGAYAQKEDGTSDCPVYVAYNFHWEPRKIALPNLPDHMVWKKVADTSENPEGSYFRESQEEFQKTIEIAPRSIAVLEGR